MVPANSVAGLYAQLEEIVSDDSDEMCRDNIRYTINDVTITFMYALITTHQSI